MTKEPTLEEVIKNFRGMAYMGGIERSKERTDTTHEVFTDTAKAVDLINRIENQNPLLFTDPNKTIIDPAMGDGSLLGECLIRRMERGCSFGESLISLRGLDLMMDNVLLCRKRLLMGHTEYNWWAEKYLAQGDALQDKYSFGEPVHFGGNPDLFSQEL